MDADVDHDADGGELSTDRLPVEEVNVTAARGGVFGFDDRDRHAHADPDLGWNLPA